MLNGSIERHKERLVAKGFTKKYGIDYEETFALMARRETIRLVLSLATNKGWKIQHMDVKSAFLNEYLNEEVFVEQPQSFEEQDKGNLVYKLKKALLLSTMQWFFHCFQYDDIGVHMVHMVSSVKEMTSTRFTKLSDTKMTKGPKVAKRDKLQMEGDGQPEMAWMSF